VLFLFFLHHRVARLKKQERRPSHPFLQNFVFEILLFDASSSFISHTVAPANVTSKASVRITVSV